MDICRTEEPELLRISQTRTARCWLYDDKVMSQQQFRSAQPQQPTEDMTGAESTATRPY